MRVANKYDRKKRAGRPIGNRSHVREIRVWRLGGLRLAVRSRPYRRRGVGRRLLTDFGLVVVYVTDLRVLHQRNPNCRSYVGWYPFEEGSLGRQAGPLGIFPSPLRI